MRIDWPPDDSRFDALLCAGLAGVFFSLNIDFRMSGDATTYATFVLLGRFNELSLHIGHYAVVYFFQNTAGRALSIPIHEMTAYLNVCFGALTVAVSYLFARRLLGTRLDGVLVAIFMTICGRVTSNATISEIYMLQTLVVLTAMLLYVDGRPVLAGVAAGLGLLVSPLSAFAYLFFPAYELTRATRPQWKSFARLLVGGSMVYLPYLLVLGHELLLGRRGLLVIRDAIPLDLSALLANVPKYQFKHYSTLLLLFVPALLRLRANSRLALLSAAVMIPHAYIVVKLTLEDNTFLLNTDFFFACWLAVGARVLIDSSRWPWAIAPIVAHLGLLIFSGILFTGRSYREYASQMREIAQSYLVGRRAVVITDWSTGMTLTHYGRQAVVSIPESDPLFRQVFDLTNKNRTAQPMLDGADILLLDPWSAGPLNRLLRSTESLERLADANSILRLAEQQIGLRCNLLTRVPHPLYRCTKI